jgi:hypothetical protein
MNLPVSKQIHFQYRKGKYATWIEETMDFNPDPAYSPIEQVKTYLSNCLIEFKQIQVNKVSTKKPIKNENN